MSIDPATAAAPTVNAENPWPGLLPFREADRHYFQGRRSETDALLRIVMRERLTLLFGLSGLGKSSLLQAGLFPLVREQNVLPVYIRFDFTSGGVDLIHQVSAAIAREASAQEIESPEQRDRETLWEYFHRDGNNFWNRRNRPVQPLVVFDQFEEIFTLGRLDSVRAQAADLFVEQLSDITEGRPPAALKQWIDAHPDDAALFHFNRHHYKILLSIREDFLPDLESLRVRMPSLALNRMRLRRMSGAAALEVVSQAERLIDPATAEQVVRFVAADRHGLPLGDLETEPALLSVVCRELNNKRLSLGHERITPGLLQGSQEQVLTDFYDRSTADLPPEVRVFIEDKLLTLSGYRDSIALDNALSAPGVTREAIDQLVERRLIRREDRGGVQRLELTHDLLAGVVRQSRNTRRLKEDAERERLTLLRNQEEQQSALLRERERRDAKRSKVAAGVFALLTLLAVGLAIWAILAQREADDLRNKADSARADAETHSKDAIRQQGFAVAATNEAKAAAITSSSRELATAALLNVGSDPELSLLLALTAAERAETPEASGVLHRALTASRIRFTLPLSQAALDGLPRVVMATSRYTELYVDTTGSHIKVLDPTGQLTTWDLSGPSPKRSQTRLQTAPSATAFSGDGKTIAVASKGGIQLWNADLTRTFGELKVERGGPFDPPITVSGENRDYSKLAFSPDGELLAASGCRYPLAGDCNLTILDVWDIPKRALIGRESHSLTGLIDAIAWSPHFQVAAGGRQAMSQEGLIAVWKAEKDAPPPTMFHDTQSGIVNGLAFDVRAGRFPGNVFVPGLWYSANRSSEIQKLDAAFEKKEEPWKGHTGALNDLVRSSDYSLVATASSDRTARIWDVAANQELFALLGHTEEVRKIAFSGDRQRLVTLGRDQKMKIWNLRPNSELGSRLPAEAVALSGDGRFVIARIADRFFARQQVVDLVKEAVEPLPETFSFTAISGDGRLIAGASLSGDIEIYTRESRQKLRSANCPRFVFRLHFAAVAERLLFACEAEPMLWDIRSERNLKLPASAPKATTGEAVSRDGQFVALRDEYSDVTVVNVAAGTSVKMSTKSQGDSDLVFSPDNRLLAGSSPEGNIVIWDISSGRLVRDFPGHAGPATALAFSTDGKLLASGGADKLTKIWDLATGEEQLSLTGHTAPVSRIAFSPDRKRLTTVAANGEVLVYALDFRDLVAIARRRVTRGLTSAECRKFLHGQCPPTQNEAR